MPKYEIPKFSTEELMAAFGSQVSPAGVIQAGRKGLTEGANLAATVEGIKQRKLKQQQEVEEIERKLKAQELLAKTVEGKPEIEKKKAALAPLAPQRAIGPVTEAGIAPTTPPSPEYQKGLEEVQAEESKRGILAKGIKAGMAPERAISALYPADVRGKISGRDIQQFYLVNPTGKERIPVTYDEVTQEMTHLITKEPVDRQKYADYQMVRATPQIRTDASGNVMIVDPVIGRETIRLSTATEEVSPEKIGTVKTLQKLPSKDREKVNDLLDVAIRDENTKKARNILQKTRNLRDAVMTDNTILVDRLGGQTQKIIAEDVGNLAAWEQRDPGARDYVTRFRNFISMGTKGLLIPKNKIEFLRLLDTYEENYLRNLDTFSEQYADSIVRRYPQLNKEAVKEMMGYGVFKGEKAGAKDRKVSPKGYSYTVE